ncbi:HNH endonuclease [Thalassospira sp. MIT1370]|uniref:HNH endonuclease n=1 Tax=unclassified Thalassospira TaxID=2648997 RepID=UPI003999AB92
MKLDIKFPELDALVRRMGATAIKWSSNAAKLAAPDIRQILWQSLEVNIEEVETGPLGLLTYKGEQVLLYILQPRRSEYTLLNEPENSPKFHVAECSTLDKMRGQGRFDRYVVTSNTSGTFNVEFEEDYPPRKGRVQADLHACKNCMKKLNYKNYNSLQQRARNELVANFDIAEFFEEYRSLFKSKPKYSDVTAPPIGYSDDWQDLSAELRRKTGWTCQSCHVDCSAPENRKLLHVHHKNGVRGDNSPSNLEVLCALCHAEQPMHKHMHVKPEVRSTITDLRRNSKPGSRKKPKHSSASRKAAPRAARQSASVAEVRQELINLRTKIANNHPDVEPSKGILRKTMLATFLDQKITSHEDYKMKVSGVDRVKTSPTHTVYLEEIFAIVSKLKK